jgi:hypothetical protein
MENLVLYYLVSGHIWFICGLSLLIIIGSDARGAFLTRPFLRRLVRLLLIALLPLAAASRSA